MIQGIRFAHLISGIQLVKRILIKNTEINSLHSSIGKKHPYFKKEGGGVVVRYCYQLKISFLCSKKTNNSRIIAQFISPEHGLIFPVFVYFKYIYIYIYCPVFLSVYWDGQILHPDNICSLLCLTNLFLKLYYYY